MAKRPDEMTVLRRLVKAQSDLLLAYRTSTRTPAKAIDEAHRCRQWLMEIEGARAKAAREGVDTLNSMVRPANNPPPPDLDIPPEENGPETDPRF